MYENCKNRTAALKGFSVHYCIDLDDSRFSLLMEFAVNCTIVHLMLSSDRMKKCLLHHFIHIYTIIESLWYVWFLWKSLVPAVKFQNKFWVFDLHINSNITIFSNLLAIETVCE